MNLFGMMNISASALQAERVRAEVVASNMANAETTRTPEGGPYQRHHVVFQAQDDDTFGAALSNHVVGLGRGPHSPEGFSDNADEEGLVANNPTPGGVAVASVIGDRSAPLERYDPQHPDAGPDGFVAYPDINPVTEMVDLIGATRSYGLNASAITAEKSMVTTSLDLLK